MEGSPLPEETFGAQMRAARNQLGWSQEELARRINRFSGLTYRQTTVAKTEAAERPLRINEAVIIAGALGTELGQLLEPVDHERTQALHELLRADRERVEAESRVAALKAELQEALESATVAAAERERLSVRFNELQEAAGIAARGKADDGLDS